MKEIFTFLVDRFGVWLVPLVCTSVGLLIGGFALWTMNRAHSPFVKIARDAVDVFASDPHLRLLPPAVALVVMLGAAILSQLLIRLFPTLDWVAHLPFGNLLMNSDLPGLILFSFCALAAQAAGLGVAVLNAVLADCFLERCHGRPALFGQAVVRVLNRLPRLLAFTFLWCALLAVIIFVRFETQLRLNSGLPRQDASIGGTSLLSIAVEFAGFALETGLVMAAYLMLVVMLREDIGPLTAMTRTLQIVRREYASTIGELASLKILDMAVYSLINAAAALGGTLGVYVWQAYYQTAPIDHVILLVGAIMMAAATMVAAGYYAIIQTLQLLLACAVFLFIHDGVLVPGFVREDFENVLCLKVSALPAGVTGPLGPVSALS